MGHSDHGPERKQTLHPGPDAEGGLVAAGPEALELLVDDLDSDTEEVDAQEPDEHGLEVEHLLIALLLQSGGFRGIFCVLQKFRKIGVDFRIEVEPPSEEGEVDHGVQSGVLQPHED